MQQTQHYPLQGGLNIVTPAIRVPSGHIIAGINYEPAEKGYRRVDGFERYDGRTKPSDATYHVITFDAGSAAVAEGDVVTGATSAATGKALIAGVVESGSYVGGDATGYLVLWDVFGTFEVDEALQVGGVTKCTAAAAANERGAGNDTDDTTWYRDAIETARTAIAAVPGSGRLRGAWALNGTRYAFRDNADGTACVMHKSTAAGWVAVDLGRTVAFTSGGTTEIAEGDTITGATSAATATVERIIVTSGAWEDGDAAGRLILSGQTGTFQAENLDVGASANLATIAGDSSAITLPAGGRYEFITHNFYGASNLTRIYGVNGVGTAFEFDGEVFVPILTGMPTDTPNHIAEFKNHLILTFPGGSVQNSGTGEPLTWTAISGAAELGMGSDVTGIADTGTGLAIICRGKIGHLYGNDATDFVLETLVKDAGGVAWTVQRIGQTYYYDDIGLRDFRAANYGDSKAGTVTTLVEPLLKAKRKAGITPTASLRVRAKQQYRLFFSDGTGITVYFRGKTPEIIPFDLGKVIYCAYSAEDADGYELLLAGSDDGYLYELDAGTSFDGEEVEAALRMPFNHVGSPTQEKRWHKATLEIDGSYSTSLRLTAEFSYADPDQPPAIEQSFDVSGGGGFWDEHNWDEFYWDSPAEGLAECSIDGLGRNLSLAVVSLATYEEPHTIHGLTLHFSYRRLAR